VISSRVWWVALLVACGSHEAKPPAKHDAAPIAIRNAAADAHAVADAAADASADPAWRTSHDFDGDHVPDAITVDYSGGAHCCYTFTLELSRDHKHVALPFQVDGGYVGGFDLSRPESFTIETAPDGVAMLRMRIASYGGRLEPIPAAWVRTYGIHSHVIRATFRGGKLAIENVAWDCAAAIEHLRALELASWEGLPPCSEAELASAIDSTSGLEDSIGTEHRSVKLRRAIVDLDASLELVLAVTRDPPNELVRIDVDVARPAAELLDALGPPDARLAYSHWGSRVATGQWVWATRGLVVYADPSGKTIHHAAVIPPTDVETYRRRLERDVK